MLLPSAIENTANGTIWLYVYFGILSVMHHLAATTYFAIFLSCMFDVFKLNLRHHVVCLVSSVVSIVTTFWICLNVRDVVYEAIADYDRIVGLIHNIFLLVATMWVYGVDRMLALFECSVGWETTYILSGKWWTLWWKLNWKYLVPSVLILGVIDAIYYELSHIYSEETLDLEIFFWAVTTLLAVSPIVFFLITTKQGGLRDRFLNLLQPTEKWGPQLSHHIHMMHIGEEDRLRIEQERKSHSKKNIATTFEELSLMM